MKTFYQLRQELTSEDTSEVEVMPEINGDTDDPKELKKKKAKKQKEVKQKVATESYDKKKAKKAKKDHDGDGKVESGKAEYFGSKDKAIKKAMKKEDSTYGYDKKGNSLNPKDIMKKKAKKRLLPKMKESIAMEATLATARKNIGKDPKKASCWKGYKATGTKMKGGKSVPDCKPK